MVVRRNGKGRGVYATQGYRQGEIVHRVPVIVVPIKEIPDTHTLAFYVFEWTKTEYALPLGNGMLFNHSYAPNLIYLPSLEDRTMRYRALRDIGEGEELTINYNGTPDDQTPVQFLDARKAKRAHGGGT